MMKRTIIIVLATLWLLALPATAGAEALFNKYDMSTARTVQSENAQILGDINADQKLTLSDVIFVLSLVTGIDRGPVAPVGDVDGDGVVSTSDALCMLTTIALLHATLQPYIDAYLERIVTETAFADSAFPELDLTFYRNGDEGPALKMPAIDFNSEGFDVRVAIGSYTPPEGNPEPVDTVRVLLFDTQDSAWGYGIQHNTLTSFLAGTPHGDNFSATYSLYIDGIKRISDGAVKGLADVDPSKGILLHVTTEAGSDFVVGENNAVKIFTSDGAGVRTPAESTLQSIANEMQAVPVHTGSCTCPDVDILSELQASFATQGVNFTADHLEIKDSPQPSPCGNYVKATIRLGSDLEVLESYQKLGQRIQNSDFRLVEPEGYFRGAHYLLFLSFYSYCDPRDCSCKCEFSWRIVSVETGVIMKAGSVTRDCSALDIAFDSMLGDIETERGSDFFILSDADYSIPDCEDGNSCTWDAYDLKSHQCVHRPKAWGATCDDGNPCTINDKCSSGRCTGTPKVCNDGNPCTEDSCNPDTGQCQSSPVANGTPCDDGDPVTENDLCTGGICKGTVNPDNPLPGVPYATGQPYFDPDPVISGSTTVVHIPVTTDTGKVSLRLLDTGGNLIAMTYHDNLTASDLVEIATPWINASEGSLYLEFFVYANAGIYGGGPYSYYSRDTSRSEAYYIIYQNDLLGHTVEKVSDIPIAWLTVVYQ